jgi:hypothetical protein
MSVNKDKGEKAPQSAAAKRKAKQRTERAKQGLERFSPSDIFLTPVQHKELKTRFAVLVAEIMRDIK